MALTSLASRRTTIQKVMLKQTCYLLKRRLAPDGGMVDVEVFEYKGTNFKCRVQPIFRRPDAGEAGSAVMEMTDLRMVYPATIVLDQADRIQVGPKVYTLRNAYDNVDDAMTNQIYINVLYQVVAWPPTLVP